MTTDLEKQFFDTFGIEPRLKYYCPSCNTELEKWLDSEGIYYRCGNHPECDYFLDVQSEDFEECLNCLNFKLTYPQITDRILLELICIAQQMKNVKVLKAFTLDCLIHDYERNVERISNTGVCQKIANEIKHQVQALFKEER